jgi:ATP-dependent DNA ligase
MRFREATGADSMAVAMLHAESWRRVHWVRPALVAEVKFLTWTEDNILRQVVYQGLREDKPAREAVRA